MNLHRRKCAFTPSRIHVLIELDGKLGYDIDGEFIVICDAPTKTSQKKLSPEDRLKKFLKESAHMRKLVAEGAVILTVDSNGNIYCHSTLEFFKYHSATGKMLEGAERDAWAKTQFKENERIIAELKQTGGRVPGGNALKGIPAGVKKRPVSRVRDMVEELVYP